MKNTRTQRLLLIMLKTCLDKAFDVTQCLICLSLNCTNHYEGEKQNSHVLTLWIRLEYGDTEIIIGG
ncbi:hypothetical protein L484_026158 [Morus notabilis]|uniref:Uncharacterized protein n=1 Tax=Morus notabilis TaxID=981085 RepID=W9RIR9_9ROSA|nr:hypothetical protein L484_026158 [Morus notabilis]